jgi:hypothetical protein
LTCPPIAILGVSGVFVVRGFRREFFKGNSIIEVAKCTLNDITTYHIWKYRCKVLYKGANAVIPTIIIANNIWLEFTSTLRARLNHIKAKANCWVYRDKVRLVPKTIASQKLEDIAAEQTALFSLFLKWECPKPFKAYNRELITPGS